MRRNSRMLRALEYVGWTCAFISLGIAIGMRVDAYVYQQMARPPVAEGSGSGTSASRAIDVAPGTPIGRLVIPRLGVDVVIAEGTSDTVLRRAVGRVATTASPGDQGNIALAGHRDTYFRPLSKIRRGDLIVLASDAGEQTYRVEWARVVEPDDIQVLSPSSYPALTLITCYPFQYVGNAPQRFVVRARGNTS